MHKEIAFSFVGASQGASRIYWDSEAGVGYTAEATTNGGGPEDGSNSAGHCTLEIFALMLGASIAAVLTISALGLIFCFRVEADAIQ